MASAVGLLFLVAGAISIVGYRALGARTLAFQIKVSKLLLRRSVTFSGTELRFTQYLFLVVGLCFVLFGLAVLLGMITPKM